MNTKLIILSSIITLGILFTSCKKDSGLDSLSGTYWSNIADDGRVRSLYFVNEYDCRHTDFQPNAEYSVVSVGLYVYSRPDLVISFGGCSCAIEVKEDYMIYSDLKYRIQ